jgi:hypothetical protein
MRYSFHKSSLFFKGFNPHLFFFLFLISCSPDSENLPSSFEVFVSVNGNGTVSSSKFDVVSNTMISITAIADEGYYFDRWDGTSEVNESEILNLQVLQSYELTAIFIPIPTLEESVEVYDPKKIDPLPVFMIRNGGTEAFLTDKTGKRIQSWNFDDNLGNELKLLDDGNLIGLFKPDIVSFPFLKGFGGIIRKIDPVGSVIWEHEINNEDYLSHHDFEILPNGNILLIIWEHFSESEALVMGYNSSGSIYLEKIIELNPETKSVEWEWRSADHLIQDFNSSTANYGQIADHPEKIDLNYVSDQFGDLMHANGLFYDSERDVILLSVNFYSEVWVISHSNTTEESITPLGDLKYRFGNPQAYQSLGERIFFKNHHPTIVELDPLSLGRFLIYVNGSDDNQSNIYEFELPSVFPNDPLLWTSPVQTWSFTDPELYFGIISGAYRLPNGNTLICEGDYGYWEVTREGEVVWKYNGGGPYFWRGYVYP